MGVLFADCQELHPLVHFMISAWPSRSLVLPIYKAIGCGNRQGQDSWQPDPEKRCFCGKTAVAPLRRQEPLLCVSLFGIPEHVAIASCLTRPTCHVAKPLPVLAQHHPGHRLASSVSQDKAVILRKGRGGTHLTGDGNGLGSCPRPDRYPCRNYFVCCWSCA